MKTDKSLSEKYQIAAQAIREADGLRIVAGAGMGTDSGLPYFDWFNILSKNRSRVGISRMNLNKYVASPESFVMRPTYAWGFYGHLLNLYRNTVPHDGFRLLREMAAELPHGAFVCTSNVGGHFQKAGFSEDNLFEISGSIHHHQCVNHCGLTQKTRFSWNSLSEIGNSSYNRLMWAADDFMPEIDLDKRQIISALPYCPKCGELARPNIRKCCGNEFNSNRHNIQNIRYNMWMGHIRKLVTISIEPDCNEICLFDMEKNGFLIRIQSWDDLWEGENFDANKEVVLKGDALEILRGIATVLHGVVAHEP